MENPSLWNQILIWPILNILIALYKLFEGAGIPGALGFAIIGLTLLIRLVTYPLSRSQLASAQKIQKLKPKIDELSKKHKDDKVKLQQAQMALYKEAGVNPAAGCLPLLIQMPVFFALYGVFIQLLTKDLTETLATINKVLYHPALHLGQLNLNFFGLDLSVKPNQWQALGWGLLLIPVITGGLQFLQTKLMTPPGPEALRAGGHPTPPSNDAPDQEKQMQSMQKNMLLLFPVMIGYAAFSFPIGLALYWNTFSLFGIMQQYLMNKKS